MEAWMEGELALFHFVQCYFSSLFIISFNVGLFTKRTTEIWQHGDITKKSCIKKHEQSYDRAGLKAWEKIKATEKIIFISTSGALTSSFTSN